MQVGLVNDSAENLDADTTYLAKSTVHDKSLDKVLKHYSKAMHYVIAMIGPAADFETYPQRGQQEDSAHAEDSPQQNSSYLQGRAPFVFQYVKTNSP